MTRRPVRTRLAVAALLLAGLTGCGAASSTASSSSQPVPSSALGTQVDIAMPAAIASLPLQRPDGSTTTFAAYSGRPFMIADYLTQCTDICPLITANTVAMAKSLQAQGEGHRVALLELSVDPQRDTPHAMTAYRALYGGALPDWQLLRAGPAATAAIWKWLGVYLQRVPEKKPASTSWLTGKPLTYDIDHADGLFFFDATGHERFVVSGNPDVQGAALPTRLTRTLTKQGRQLLKHPDPVQSWTVAQGMTVFSWLTNRHLRAA